MTGLKLNFQKVLNLKIFNSISLIAIFILGFSNVGNSQCDINNPYDKIISSFHSSIALKSDGSYAVWGQLMNKNGTSDVLSPQDLNSTNYTGLTGTVLKASVGGFVNTNNSFSSNTYFTQGIVLTTNGLFAWGTEGSVLSTELTTSSTFQKITTPVGGDVNTGLPTGVNPADVSMLIAANRTLVILTNTGYVWILSLVSNEIKANGLTGSPTAAQAKTWYKAKTSSGIDLTGIKSVRLQVSNVNYNAIMALSTTGSIYTWGKTTYLGNNTGVTSKNYATLMTLPIEFTSSNIPKMIAVTGGSGYDPNENTGVNNTLYVLSNSGALYSLGDNSNKQIGDFTTTDRLTWVNAERVNGTNFSNVNSISVQEHDGSWPGVAIVTKTGDLYTWGNNSGLMIGRNDQNTLYDPGFPNGFTSGTDKALYVEIGGHTTVYLKEGSTKFCYVGHKVGGSMGDGSNANTNESTFNCTGTPNLSICGSVPFPGSLTNSVISANPSTIAASGTSTSVITVQLKQSNGTNLTSTGGTVEIITNKGSISSVTDNNNGTYTAILTSSTFNETANITYTLNGSAGISSTTVTFITPVLSTAGSLKTFSSCSGCSIAPQSFTVSGVDLSTNNIVVAAPTGFEVSTTSNSGYATSINLTPTAGTVTTTTVYTRLINNAASVASGVISITSTGAASKTMTVTTNTDNALMFDGVGDYVEIGDVLDNTSLANTTEAWVYWKGSANPHTEIFSKDLVQSVAITNGNNLHANFGNGTSWSTGLNSTTLIPLNKWTHVAITRSSTGVVKMYINGVLDASTNTMNILGNNSALRCIGGKNVSGTMFGLYNGAIDNIKAWNVEKIAAEISNGMYSELLGNELNLLAYYNFNQGVANGTNTGITTLTDFGSSSFNGTISGIALTGTTSNFVNGFIPDISATGNATSVIASSTLSLTNALVGGVWSSTNSNIATINPSTGLVTGVAGGSVTMTYTICNKQVSYNINVLVPTLTSGSLKTFTSCSGCSIPPQSFTVSGTNLTSNVTVNAPTGFEISNASNGTYTSTLTLIPSSGTLSSTSVFARLKNSAITAISGNFTVVSSGANSKTVTATVVNDNSLAFDGVGDYVVIPDNNALDVTSTLTIETWMYPTSNTGSQVVVGKIDAGGNSSDLSYALRFNSGTLSFEVGNGTISNNISTTNLKLNQWQHVVGVFNSGNLKIYINGVQVASGTVAVTSLKVSTSQLRLGHYNTTYNQNYFGALDEVRIWNTARTLSEITGSMYSNLAGDELGLVAYYDFDNGTANGNNAGLTALSNKAILTSAAINGTLTNFNLSGTNSNFVNGAIAPITAAGDITTLVGGNTLQLSNGMTGGTWSSTNTSLATIDVNTGLVTAITNTSGTVTLTYTICNKSVPYVVNVERPTIILTNTLKTFTSCSGCTISAQSFTVSGTYLTSNVTINAPTGFEISNASNGTFTSTLTLIPSSGTLSSTSVFARLKNNALTATSGNFTVISTGATSKTITATVNTDNAINFDGVNDIISTASNVAPLNITGNITVETWIRLNQMPTDYVRLIGKGSPSERTYGLWLYSDGSLLWQQFNTNFSINNLITNNSIIPVGKWCHIAVTRTGSNVKIYLNGNEVASSSAYTGTPNSSTASLEIGGSSSIHALLNGMMDEVRIWNVGRTAGQILGSYLSELNGDGNANETGLVAYYNFNQGIAGGSNSSISVIEDRTSNGISATLTNFAKTGTTSNFVAGQIPPISGNNILYKAQTTTYTNGLIGGTWSSSATNIATVDANTGVVTGVNSGTSTISYTICDKTVSQLITVVVPTITTTGSLTNFSTCVGTASNAQTFTVSAVNLTASLTLSAPTGYEISLTSGGTYSNTLTIVPSSGTVSNTSIFVRLKSSAFNGATGNIVASSLSATSINIATGVASVTANAAASVTISSNAISNVTCPGNNVIFTAAPTNGGSSPTYQWKVNGVNVGTNTRTYATTSLANNDVVTVVMASSLTSCVTGTPASSNSITITVNSTPNTPGVIAGNNIICLGSNVVYSVSSVAGATSYEWVVSGNISASTSTSTVLNALASNTAGAATVKVRAVNACGASAYTADYNITISNTPAPTADFIISNNQICLGNAINFSDASIVNATTNSPITSYSWNFGDGSGLVTTQNSSRIYTAGGTYNVVFSIQSQDNCNASISKSVVVNPLSVGGTAAANNASVCAGTGTSISLSGNVGSIQWMSSPSGANTWTNITNANGTSLNTGNLTATTDFKAVVTSGLCSSASSNIVTVTVNPIPSMTLSVPSLVSNTANSFDLGYTILAGSPDNYTINAISPNSMPGYTSINNYGLTSNPLIISIPVTSNGIYNFELIANNATSGCNSAAIPFNINIGDLPPAGLSYTTPNVYTVGTTISSLSPTSTGGPILSYSITPSLPAGLSFNTSNGIISGTPSAISAQTNYIVTGTNGSGSITATVVITVIIAPPTGLSYNSPNVYTVGNTITSLTPSITGGAISTYTISPSLSAGLVINPNTGVISGTPSQVASQTSYIVTGTNTSGTISATVVITVNIAPPSSLIYNTPNVYTVGTVISTLTPTTTGGTITSYSISPNLPSGLQLNSNNGTITGTPTIISPQTSYVVTGTNVSGTISTTVVITVKIAPPLSLSYTSPNIYTVGTLISSLNPTTTGGTISQYSIAPNLPSGLTINPTSGIISGTPTVISSQTSYTVTGNNSSGSISATVVITVISGTQPPAPPIVQNGKFIFGKSTIPNSLNPFVGTLPVGVVPVWCTPGTTNCTTVTPVMPTAIGTYVYQVRTYDTAKQLYSTDFVNNTIIIAPPPPIVFDSTYVVGVVNNPLNVGLQVSGLTGATFNYYYLGVLQNVVPVLGKTIGSKNYTVSQTVNGVESDTVSFAVTMLDPNSIIHLQKMVDTAIMQVNSSYNYPFTFVVTNLTKYNFNKVIVTDDLNNSVPNTSEFSIVKNMATGGLVANSSYDGKTDINVTTASSSLAAFAKDTAKFTMNLIPKGYAGILSNIAYVRADTKWGTIIMQSSDKSSNDLSSKNPTKYVVKDLTVYIPEGFSPNNDGVHDNFVIIRPFGVKLDIQIFNRWGNVVYANADYKNDWNGQGTGNFAGQDLVNGGYYYTVKAYDEFGKTQIFKGFVIIQR